MPRTIVVIPCYNEAKRLKADVFVSFVAATQGIELLFVNDGSTDDTQRVLDGLVAHCPERLSALPLEKNGGKAEAVRRGFVQAFETDPDYVAFWDADLATPLEDVQMFVDILEERKELLTVFGSRVNLLGRQVQRALVRHYVGRVFATAAAFVLRLGIYDTQCGAKMFRNVEAVREIFREPFLSSWIFDVELIARLRNEQAAINGPPLRQVICEEPLRRWIDVAGSKIKARDFLTVGLDLVRIWRTYGRGGRQP